MCGCLNVTEVDGVITSARIAFGGMAGTPKRAAAVEAALVGAPFTRASFEAAAARMGEDFTPLTDMRASDTYRLRVAQNMLSRYALEMEGGTARLIGPAFTGTAA